MKRKFKVLATFILAGGLAIGWNLQNKQIAEALLGNNTRISDTSAGAISSAGATITGMSKDGRYAVLHSLSSNLVSGDTNGKGDIFLRDLSANTITRVSVDSSGNQSNDSSSQPAISGNGKYVFYLSNASNLVSGDTNGMYDVFRYTIATGAVTRISVDASGNEANGNSSSVSSDYDGRFIAFSTQASNLGTSDSNGVDDIVVKDLTTGVVTYVSKSNAGVIGNSDSSGAKISCDGRFIAFNSNASNLVASDTNGQADVFLTDMLGTQTVINLTLGGNSFSGSPAISCDGNYIAFNSNASNLVASDTNGQADVFRYSRTSSSTSVVSMKESGGAPTASSSLGDISSDGRFVTFISDSSSFSTSTTDTNGNFDVYLRDMNNSSVRMVSIKPSGGAGNGNSQAGIFSGSNRIAFTSTASDLVTTGPTDTNGGWPDSFVADVGTPNTCSF